MTMVSAKVEELMRRAQNDEDISGETGVGAWEAHDEPIAPVPTDGPVTVGKTVRLTFELMERIRRQADAQRTDASKLMRAWIEDGLERAESGEQVDPVVELDRAMSAISHARDVIRQRDAA